MALVTGRTSSVSHSAGGLQPLGVLPCFDRLARVDKRPLAGQEGIWWALVKWIQAIDVDCREAGSDIWMAGLANRTHFPQRSLYIIEDRLSMIVAVKQALCYASWWRAVIVCLLGWMLEVLILQVIYSAFMLSSG